jgi:hypothetical protein
MSNNPKSAYILHILHSKHEYGTMNAIMSLLHPVHKRERINSLENFCINFFQQCNSVIIKQSQEVLNLSLISSMVYNSITHVHDPHPTLSHSVFDFRDFPTYNISTTSLGTYHTDNHFIYMQQYIFSYICINNLLLTFFISGW